MVYVSPEGVALFGLTQTKSSDGKVVMNDLIAKSADVIGSKDLEKPHRGLKLSPVMYMSAEGSVIKKE